MSRKVRILGLQIAPKDSDKEANLKKVENLIDENSWYKPDLVVLPEVFNTGLNHKLFHQLAEPFPGGMTSEVLSSLAFKYNTNIIGGSCIESCSDGKFRNTSAVFDRTGKMIAKYSKIHMFSYYGSKEGEYVTPGDSITVVETDFGKIGLSICYDIRFPELFRALAYGGAEMIVCCAAWAYPRLDHWVTFNKARAVENLAYFVSANQAGKVFNSRLNIGHSMVINPWGEVVASAGGNEGVMMAEIDLDLVASIREEFPVLNDRNLGAYANDMAKIQ